MVRGIGIQDEPPTWRVILARAPVLLLNFTRATRARMTDAELFLFRLGQALARALFPIEFGQHFDLRTPIEQIGDPPAHFFHMFRLAMIIESGLIGVSL